MDYPIALSPELGISAEEFMAAWNDTLECKDIALAELREEPPAGFSEPSSVLIFLSGVVSTVTLNVISNLITKIIEERLFKKNEVVSLEQDDGTHILAVNEKEE